MKSVKTIGDAIPLRFTVESKAALTKLLNRYHERNATQLINAAICFLYESSWEYGLDGNLRPIPSSVDPLQTSTPLPLRTGGKKGDKRKGKCS